MSGVVCDHLHENTERRALEVLEADIKAIARDIAGMPRKSPMRSAMTQIIKRKRTEYLRRCRMLGFEK